MTTTLAALAQAAKPIDEDDWGSERQIAAENAFFDAVAEEVTPEAFEDLEERVNRMTTEEMIAEAMWLATTPGRHRARLRD